MRETAEGLKEQKMNSFIIHAEKYAQLVKRTLYIQ